MLEREEIRPKNGPKTTVKECAVQRARTSLNTGTVDLFFNSRASAAISLSLRRTVATKPEVSAETDLYFNVWEVNIRNGKSYIIIIPYHKKSIRSLNVMFEARIYERATVLESEHNDTYTLNRPS